MRPMRNVVNRPCSSFMRAFTALVAVLIRVNIAVFRARSKQTSQMRQSTDPTEEAFAEEWKSASAT
jgi:hypothetical protein